MKKTIFTIKIYENGDWKTIPVLDKETQNILGHHFDEKIYWIYKYLKLKGKNK